MTPSASQPPFPLPSWTDHWDPRPSALALGKPYAGVCNIPLEELGERTSELGPRDAPMAVVAEAELLERALKALSDLGRLGTAAPERMAPAKRYEPRRLWRPNPFLEEIAPLIAADGRALDCGCGSGREAVFLASWGWRVEAIDVLPKALATARQMEALYGISSAPRVNWVEADLETGFEPATTELGLITCFRYLHRPLIASAANWLAPGGSLVVETFTEIHRQHHGKPRRERFVLAEGELPELAAGLEVRRYEEGWHAGAHTARLWASKPC